MKKKKKKKQKREGESYIGILASTLSRRVQQFDDKEQRDGVHQREERMRYPMLKKEKCDRVQNKELMLLPSNK